MKRKAIIVASGFFFGAFVSFHLNLSGIVAFMLLLFACIIFTVFLPLPKRTACMFAAFCTLLACAYSFCNFAFVISKLEALDGETVSVVGEVIDHTSSDRSSVTISGTVNGIDCKLITYINDFSGDLGDMVTFSGKASSFSDSPFFNAKTVYYPDGIYLKVVSVGDIEITDGDKSFATILGRYSKSVSSNIRSHVGGEAGDILCAMICGDSSYINDETSLLLSRAGIRHVIAVSGLHVSVVAAVLMFILRKLRLTRLASAIITETGVILYVIFSGGRISCIRAAIMMSVYIVSTLSRRKPDPLNTLSVAALIILIFNPYAAADPSFCLSLAGTFGVSVASSSLSDILDIKSALARSFASCVCASFCTVPFVMLWFNEISIISMFVNMIFVPICSVALCFGFAFCLLGCAPAVDFLADISGKLIEMTLYCCEYISKLKLSYLPTGLTNTAVLLAITIVLFFTALFFRRKQKALALSLITAMCITVCSLAFSTLPDNSVTLDVLCQNGNCLALLRKNEECIIIDIDGTAELKDECDDVIQRYGITDVLAVTINDRGESGYSAYSKLSVTPDIIYLPKGSYIFSGEVRNDTLPESFSVFEIDIRLRDGLAVFSQGEESIAISVGDYYEVGTKCNVCVLDDICVVSSEDTTVYNGDAFFSLEFDG